MAHARRMRPTVVPVAGALALAAAGCGSPAEYANTPRPATPIVVTASISRDSVSVSPQRFGAGPISVIVTNQTGAAQQVTLATAGGGAELGLRRQTAPISPRDTATLTADVDPGRYTLSVGGDAIAPARLRVGAPRDSAQHDLLQP